MKIGVIGSNGFVGSELYKVFIDNLKNQVIGITRSEFDSWRIRRAKYDFLIHVANPARRLRAENDPTRDYLETVDKTDMILNEFRFSRLLLISSLSCRTQPNSIYGRHRLECERMVVASGGSVVRLGPMYAGHRNGTTLEDIIHGRPVFFSEDTKYSYTNVGWNASYIAKGIQSFGGISEIGARNFISLREIAQKLNSKSKFGTLNDDQIVENFTHGPDAYELLRYLEGDA